jgi:hypothetical protein
LPPIPARPSERCTIFVFGGQWFYGYWPGVFSKNTERSTTNSVKTVEAGGTLVKPAARTPWGIADYFKDPDGHLFEVDYEEIWVFEKGHTLVVDNLNE